MGEARRIIIRTDRNDGYLKVVWEFPSGDLCDPYFLLPGSVNEKIRLVRLGLDHLFSQYLTSTPDFENCLTRLAALGHDLRRSIFDDCLPRDFSKAQEIESWFKAEIADRSSPLFVTVFADPFVPIPWGLLHEGDTSKNYDTYNDFWANRFNVAARYNGMKLPPRAQRIGTAKLIAGVNEEVFFDAMKPLDREVRDYITGFFNLPVGLANTSLGCKERRMAVGDNDCLFHFFGHATGESLHFSSVDRLTVPTFRSHFRIPDRSERNSTQLSYVLSILNGCSSVTGVGDESFLIATADPGLCGFIGPEARVPDKFGLLFGQELLYLLLVEGSTVREAMSRLWSKHRPMGLYYGCYADPDFQFAAIDHFEPLPLEFENPNYVGTGTA